MFFVINNKIYITPDIDKKHGAFIINVIVININFKSAICFCDNNKIVLKNFLELKLFKIYIDSSILCYLKTNKLKNHFF